MIKLYCLGNCVHNGKPEQIAGCGIIAIRDTDGKIQTREFGYALGSVNAHIADLKAIQLGLMCVESKFRKEPVKILIGNKYLLKSINDNRNVSKDEELNSAIKKWYTMFTKIETVYEDSKNPLIMKTRELAKHATKTQKNFDSLTY